MLQELEQQNPIMALEEEHSLLSSDVPLVIQYHNEPLDDCIQPIPSTNFDLNSAEDLPSHFYNHNYDPIGHVLQSMPHWCSEKSAVDEYITQLLSQADECQATINVQLNSLIVQNRPDIQKGIQQLYNIDREVSSAILYWNQARHFVDSARRQAFLQESLTLIQNSRMRSNYQKILKTIEQCSNITALEKELNTILDDTTTDHWTPHSFDDYQRFMKMAMDLKTSANDGLGELKCFSQLKQRSSAVLTTVVGTLLHRELEHVLVLSCREKGFSNSQYSTLLQVHLKLQGRIGQAFYSRLDSWSLTILKSLTNEADQCMTHVMSLVEAHVEENGVAKPGLSDSLHRLCMELTNILHSYYLIEQWHVSPFDLRNVDINFLHRFCDTANRETPNAKDPSSSTDLCDEDVTILNGIRLELVRHRLLLWNHCESLLERLIDAHLIRDYSLKSSLSLPSLTYLIQIEHLMESVVQEFIGSSISCSDFDPDSFFRGLRNKLSSVCLYYLHCFHRESLSVISTMLLNESWQLISADTIDLTSNPILSEQISETILTTGRGKNKANQFLSQAGTVSERFFSNYYLKENVFSKLACKSFTPTNENSPSDLGHVGYQELLVAVTETTTRHEGRNTKHFGGTQTAVNGLARLTAKYLHLMKALPLIASDIATSLSLLFDFYFVSILRLCTGNEANENALLGYTSSVIVASNINPSSDRFTHRRSSSTNSSKVGKQAPSRAIAMSPTRDVDKHKSSRTIIPKTIEALIASATPSESMRFAAVREFIEGAQKRLLNDKISTNFHCIVHRENETSKFDDTFICRYCAAKSMLFVATLLDGASKLSSSGILQDYSASVSNVVSTLTDSALRMAAVRAVGGERVVQDILRVGRGWEEAEIVDGSNAYIDDLCNRCICLWARLSFLKNYNLATCAWDSVVSSAFLSLLEGFSMVFVCSTEGRALMSMDLASFAAGVSFRAIKTNSEGIECRCLPPSMIPSIPNGMQYVDAVVKAFYFGEHDLMKWIKENRDSYRLEHCTALVISSVGGRRSAQYVNEMIDAVKLLY